MQVKNMMYEENKQTVDICANGWQTRSKELGSEVTKLFHAPSSLAGAVSDLRPNAEPKASGGESGCYADSSFAYHLDVGGKVSPP